EKLRAYAVPGGAKVRVGSGIGASFDIDRLAPIVAFERAVEREPNALYFGDRAESLLQGLVQRRQFLWRISRALWVDVYHIAIRGLNTEILMLQVVKTLRKQSGANEENQRQRRLHDDERFLRQRGVIARSTVDAAQSLGGIGVRRDPRGRHAERH